MRGVRRLLWRCVLLVLAALVLYEGWCLVRLLWWNYANPTTSAVMRERLEALAAKNPQAVLRHRWVAYGRISVELKRAIVAAEDANFLEHEGFDWEAIQKAVEKNVKRGRVVAGGSTISQQLAKNLFLTTQRSAWRKAQEAAITLMMEGVMPKRRILELYLNLIEWGEGVFGAEAAARHYFGKGAATLEPWEAARLAAMVPNPRFYDRNRATPFLERKTALILQRMRSASVP
jgi:monofunctional biosynthetic peptidoglycan transglycosylase